jgi:hypothetical protein
MSADNWARCPKCQDKHDKEWALKVKKVESLYGKVSAEEFIKARETIREKPKLEETFREDYEIGLDKDGTFSVGYVGGCTYKGCGFKVSYSYKKEVFPETCEKP